ncbi:threonine-phosphate decarboxylase [Gordonia amarae]|uniref:Aminotransferase n=2 Tax=Gordonia amarae TaxID=36821 RepID=G7GPW9_9ACTN|nr:Rv2231c family pyridoxal phosphate-dependent protein CobC [Gordonia amarae]MCS3879662.1 histidinol-phosphate aminotransferase [Gordonia amarae]QHN18105.1 threonine-phosphate decarboxylase [Gordonia amarae]QHN22626.1 threonine-phosphate decarboxylase [Gordonia amarae]QHN31492.1 threonine-phosphate decarboxylase [Gordonia amarae]QHN40236.1 threonine-phosphate decarboxylase [Gordonia amarae]
MSGDLFSPDRHGDSDSAAGLLDFAVNVREGPPRFVLDALGARLPDLARYPTAADEARAVAAVAAAHGRPAEEILLLSGAAEGFELLPRLGIRHAALIQPSFTEPELALRAAGIPITQVVLERPWRLGADDIARLIPADADLVVIGNPTNPTSVLHPAATIEALRAPGRVVVVDEAFADLTVDPGSGEREPESVAARRWPDVIVVRSITKTFGLAGLRAGYLLADREIIERLSMGRRPWALGTLALVALTECVGAQGQRYCDEVAATVAGYRAGLVDGLRGLGIEPAVRPQAPFVLIEVRDGLGVKERLRERGIAVRSAANFVGLGPGYLRLAVRDEPATAHLVDALRTIGGSSGLL